MACPCRRNKVKEVNDDDPETAETYVDAFDNEENISYVTDRDDEQVSSASIEYDIESIDDNICTELIFVDGNDRDLKSCEYEDTLLERIWLLSKPPKIPRQICTVPARKIQVMKERLSPVLKGLPTTTGALSDTVNEKRHRRNKIDSDVEYVRIMNFNDEIQASCQTKTVTAVPHCAEKLEKFL